MRVECKKKKKKWTFRETKSKQGETKEEKELLEIYQIEVDRFYEVLSFKVKWPFHIHTLRVLRR